MKKLIAEIIKNAVLSLQKEGNLGDFEIPKIEIDYPKEEKFGDYSSNIAMILGKKIGKNPMETADQIAKLLNGQIVNDIGLEKAEVAAPGYINFYLSQKYLQDKVAEINRAENNFGNSEIGRGIKINNEFISANPTGPLTVGNGRGGFYGDSLSRILRKAGYEVANEYYVNDAGEQVMKLGHSVLKDDEAVYAGEYIDALNEKYKGISDAQEVGEKAAEDILQNIIQKTVKEKMQINFDNWVSEKKIQSDKYVDRVIDLLKEKKLTYESEGALWLKTTEFGDDKDRVLIKSNGQKSYFANDCGYILNKLERNFKVLIIGLGADHHGYVSRLKSAAKALGFSGDFSIIVSQLVRVVKDGKEVRMSKRAGNVVYIDDLLSEVGHDVARFFFLLYSPDTHMNFDLGLAKEHSEKNPVFYVQYAYARICSILRKAQEMGVRLPSGESNFLELLTHEKELSLIKEVNKFPELVEEIAESYAVHKLPQHVIRLADKFHSFYNACQVIEEDNLEMTLARLDLIKSVKIVLEQTLDLIGVEAPEKM